MSVARGATLMVAMRGISRIIGIFSTAVLARILTPDDFGLVVLGTSVLNIVQMLSETSMSAALIRMRNPTAAHFDTAWTISLLRGVVAAGIVTAIAPIVARSMHEHRVVAILWMLAATTIIQSFENIRLIDFQREMQFGTVFKYQLATRIISFVATLILALILRNYWALIISSTVTTIVTVAYSYLLRPHRPRLSLSAWADLFDFSRWAVLGSYLAIIDAYSINFIMGWLGGPRTLGLYQVSAQIAALPASEIAAPIRQPMYAAFSKLLDNRVEMANVFVQGFGFLFLVITPLSMGIFATASMISPLALGPQWSDAAPMIRAVVFYALFDAFGHYPQNLFIILDKQPRLLMLACIFLAIRVPAAIYGGWVGGMTGAVYGMTATALFGFLFWFAASLPLVRVTPVAILSAIWRSIIASAAMVGSLAVLAQGWPLEKNIIPLLAQFLTFVTAGASIHIACLLLLWHLSGKPAGAESRALSLIAGYYQRVMKFRPMNVI